MQLQKANAFLQTLAGSEVVVLSTQNLFGARRFLVC